jgi:lactoylglutathione lyase
VSIIAQACPEHNAEQQAGDDQLHRRGHAARTGEAGAMTGEELAPAGARQPHDVLDVRRRGSHRTDSRRIQHASHRRQRDDPEHAAAHLEPSRVDVLVGNPVGGSMQNGPEDHGPEPGARERAGRGPRGNVHGNDHGDMKAKLVGINHVALEVGDVEAALEFYGRIFDLELRGRAGRMAFVDIGDQFIALAEGRRQSADEHRHFGLVVDDKQAALRAAREAGAEVRGNDFRDPWGNNVQVVAYEDVQFTKAPEILRGMGLNGLEKTERARHELRDKGLA